MPSTRTLPNRAARDVGALVAWVGVLWAMRSLLGLWGALGTDAPLWGLTARDLWVGAAPLVPPLYPAISSLPVALGMSPIIAGTLVSMIGIAILIETGRRLARQLGASPRAAMLIGVSLLVIPDIPGWGFQLQPDATAAAAGLLLALGLVRVHGAQPRTVDALLVVVVSGLAPLLREHGLIWASAGFLGLATAPGAVRRLALAIPFLVWFGPVVVGVRPGMHPLDVPWMDRAGGALAAFSATDPSDLSFLRELPRTERAAYQALIDHRDRLGQWLWHLRRTLQQAPDGWVLLTGAGGAALWMGRRTGTRCWRAVVLPLLAALPALLIWSQRRHVLVVVPVAIVILGVVASRQRRLWLPFAASLAVHGAINWPASVRAWQSERPRAEHYAALGSWLQTHARPGDLLGGVHQDIGLYAPAMPRHDPDGSLADWKTFHISERAPPSRTIGEWTLVFRGAQLAIWQLDPDRQPRPCADVDPPPNAAHLAIASAQVSLAGCKEPAIP